MSYTNHNDSFFKIVPDFFKPLGQLMSLHGFVRRDGREQQLISAELFALMSSRQEEDYVQVSDQSYCRDILIHSTVIYLVPIYTLLIISFSNRSSMPSWKLSQLGQESRDLWWTLSLVRIFFLSYVILNNSLIDSGL